MPKSHSHRTHSSSRRPQGRTSKRQLSVRGVLRKEPNLEKIAGTVEALAIAHAEKAAQDAYRAKRAKGGRS